MINGGLEGRSPSQLRGLLGSSRAIRDLLDVASRSARSTATVLIQGETGTGKELLARFIHSQSPRYSSSLVSVNAGAFSPNLLESELFGHIQGAFTGADRERIGFFESANGGTLFLDEIGELAPGAQVRLLRILQDGYLMRLGESVPRRIDIRLIAATHRDLAKEVDSGRFRQDLFYRLNVINLRIPPLRERAEDIPQLSRHFIEVAGREYGKQVTGISDAALEILKVQPWPGNVRELENCMRKAVIMATGSVLTPSNLPESFRQPVGSGAEGTGGAEPVAEPHRVLREAMDRYAEEFGPHLHAFNELAEKILIVHALNRERGVKLRAAKRLGINRVTLDRKIAEHHLQVKRGVGVINAPDE